MSFSISFLISTSLSISILGLYLGEVFIYGCAVPIFIGIYNIYKNPKVVAKIIYRLKQQSALIGLILVVFLAWFYSSVTGIKVEASLEKFSEVFLVVAGFLILYLSVRPIYSEEIFKKICHYLAFGFPILSILILFEASEVSSEFNDWLRGRHGNLFLGDVTAPLTVFFPLALIAYFSWTKDQETKKRMLTWTLPVIFFAAIIAANARSAWIGYAGAMVTFFILYPGRWRSKIELLIMHLIGGIIGAIGYVMNAGWHSAKHRIGGSPDLDGVSSGRLAIWEYCIEQWAQHPMFGIGMRGYRYLPFDGIKLNSYTHPHNIFVQIGLETGWVGLSAFLILCGYLMYRYLCLIWKKPDLHQKTAGPAAGVVAFGIASLTWTSIFYTWWIVVGLLPVVFTAWQLQTKNDHA